MANFIERDKRKRNCYLNFFKKRENLKKLLKDREQEMPIRYKAQIDLNNLIKDSSKVRLSNRCLITGRTHSVLKIFRMFIVIFDALFDPVFVRQVCFESRHLCSVLQDFF